MVSSPTYLAVLLAFGGGIVFHHLFQVIVPIINKRYVYLVYIYLFMYLFIYSFIYLILKINLCKKKALCGSFDSLVVG